MHHADGCEESRRRGARALCLALCRYCQGEALAAMDSTVACRAQRDQVFLCVGSRMAAEFPVVHLKIRHRAA
jgi:hypothetical protein